MAALFTDALRNPALSPEDRAGARGERVIWLILAGTGLASILVSMTRYGVWAAMLYMTLPLSIGLFTWRYDWLGVHRPAPPPEEAEARPARTS